MVIAGVGLSQAAESGRAAEAALAQALAPLGGAQPAALLCFATVDHARGLEEVGARLAATGCGCVVGCTGGGVIAGLREVEAGPALVVAAIGGEGVRATPFHDPRFHEDNRAAGRRVAQAVEPGMGENPLLLAFLDPYTLEGPAFLEGVAELGGRLPVVGAAAADDGAHGHTYQLGPAGVTAHGVSGCLLSGAVRHHVALAQACHPLMPPEVVTAARGSRVDAIGGRPAMAVLAQLLRDEGILQFSGAPGHICLAVPLDPASATLRPGEFTARDVVGVDPERGSVFVAGEVVAGQAAAFALLDPARALRATQRTVARAARDFPEPALGLYVDCRGRGRALYQRPDRDAQLIGHAFPHLPLAGLFSYAELCPVEGRNRMHNYAGVLLLLA